MVNGIEVRVTGKRTCCGRLENEQNNVHAQREGVLGSTTPARMASNKASTLGM